MKRIISSEHTTLPKKKKSAFSVSSEISHQGSKKDTTMKFGKRSSPGKKNGKGSFKAKTEKTKASEPPEKQNYKKNENFKRVGLVKGKPKLKKGVTMQKKTGKEKGKNNTVFKEFSSNLLGKDGKPKWNKVKDEKKKLREDRRVQRTGAEHYQLSIKAKSIWEKLRKKSLTAEKKEGLVNDLFTLLKGQIPNVVHSHDMARVVQWMLKLGSPSIRTSICEELCSNTVLYLQSKYASYCVRRALRYGTKSDRNHLIESCNGHFLKLLAHTFACPVVELMYAMFASAKQRLLMHKELYGDMHALLPPEVTAIENIPDNMKAAILVSTKTNLTKLLAKKPLLKSTLLQSVLNDYLVSCSEQDRNEIFELIQGDILDLLNTKEGVRVALLAVWYATNKMKKVIVKKLKGKVKEIATSEMGHTLLMALFDCIDDTVLVKKALIPELLSEAEELAKHELGRKVLLYLVAHRDPAYFHPQQIEILAKGDTISTGKKDATVREQEMLEAVSWPLLQKIADDPVTWLGESSVAMVSLAVMKSGKGETLQAAFEKVVDYILDPSSVVEVNNMQVHVVEHSAMHFVFKKLIQQDQTHPDRTEETFSTVLVTRLTEDRLNHILQFNRGCFLLVLLFESKNKTVCKTLKSKITESMKTFLQQQETTGSKILLKKLNEEKKASKLENNSLKKKKT